MAQNRASRRANASKKKSGKILTKRKAPANSNGNGKMPALSAIHKKKLSRIREEIRQIEAAVADLELRKTQLLPALAQKRAEMQAQMKSALLGAGVDLDDGPKGVWSIDLDTMGVTFDEEAQPAAAQTESTA